MKSHAEEFAYNPFTFEAEPFLAVDVGEIADLGDELEFENETSLDGDFELLGEVCRGFEIDSVDYIKWVQRSLNRILGSGIVVDGKLSEKYRNAVRQFQQQSGLTVNGQVDSKTQNKLILANEANADYVRWAQRALNTDGAGLDPDGKIGSSSSSTKKAIRAYQKKRTPGLCVDGFLGAKTELFLMGESGIRPPGDIQPVQPPKPTVKAPTEQEQRKKLAKRLLSIEIEGHRDRRLNCILAKITGAIVDGDKLDDRFLRNHLTVRNVCHHLNPMPERSELHFVKELMRHVNKSDKGFRDGVTSVYKEMIDAMVCMNKRLQGLLLEPGRFSAVKATEECRVIQYFLRKARTPHSLYACFKPWILKTFCHCEGTCK
jgi:hypothetical protein